MGRRQVLSEATEEELAHKEKSDFVRTKRRQLVTAKEYRKAVKTVVKRVENAPDGRESTSELSSSVRNLLQSRRNGPLLLWWMLSAVEKATWRGGEGKEFLDLGSANLGFAVRLFTSLKSLSAVSADGRTALSALAPVVAVLYDVALMLSNSVGSLEVERSSKAASPSAKQFRKLSRRLNELVKDILGFSFLCHCRDSKNFKRTTSLPLAPSVTIKKPSELLYPAFPLTNKNVAKLETGDPPNAAVVAEAVAAEVVLLQLALEIINRRRKLKKQNLEFSGGEEEFSESLRQLAGHSVCAGSSGAPSEMLLDLLVEDRLPVLELLDTKEETLLRGVLFDAVLVDPPLFRPFVEADEMSVLPESSLDHHSLIFFKKLSVARQAVTYFRSRDQHGKVLALSTKMMAWDVPGQLLNWFKSQKKQLIPATTLQDQKALTHWLVTMVDEKAFTAMLNKSGGAFLRTTTSGVGRKSYGLRQVETGEETADGEDGEATFFVDTVGDKVDQDSTELAADVDFTAAAKSMNGMSDNIRKKNEKKRAEEEQSKHLFQRHEQASSRIKRPRTEIDDDVLSDSNGDDSEGIVHSDSPRSKKSKYVGSDSSSDDGEVGALTSSPSGRFGGAATQIEAEQEHEELHAQQIITEERQKFENLSNGKDANSDVLETVGRHIPEYSAIFDEIATKRIHETPGRGASPLGTLRNVQDALGNPQLQRKRSKERAGISENAPRLECSPPATTEMQLAEEGADDILVELESDSRRQGQRQEMQLSSSPAPVLAQENVEGFNSVKASRHGRSMKTAQEKTPAVSLSRSSKKKRVKEVSGGDDPAKGHIYDSIRNDLASSFASVSSADLIDALQRGEPLEVDQQADGRGGTKRTKRTKVSKAIESGPEVAAVEMTGAEAACTPKVAAEASESSEKQLPSSTHTTYRSRHPSNNDNDDFCQKSTGTAIPRKENTSPSFNGISNAAISESNNVLDDSDVLPPVAVVEVLEPGPPASSSGTKNGGSARKSSGIEAAAEELSPRRTRSGRSFGSPSPTPTPRRTMRRKLVLDPLQEEKPLPM